MPSCTVCVVVPDLSRPPLVFLSSGGNRRGDVERFLQLAGISYLSSSDYERITPVSIRTTIQRCGAVVAFLTSIQPPVGVILEIGAGLGLGLPVVLVMGAKVQPEKLPAALRDIPSMRMPDQYSSDALERLVGLLQIGRSLASTSPKSEQLRRVDTSVNRIAWADGSERAVGEVLLQLGTEIVAYEPANRQGRADVAVWVPALSGVPFNPILVEVAGKRASQKQREAQLRKYMSEAGALIGLLVMQEPASPAWRVQSTGATLTIGIDQLAGLTADDFEALMLDGRNRLFHASS